MSERTFFIAFEPLLLIITRFRFDIFQAERRDDWIILRIILTTILQNIAMSVVKRIISLGISAQEYKIQFPRYTHTEKKRNQ